MNTRPLPGLLALLVGPFAAIGASQAMPPDGAPVHFNVATSDGHIFYSTRVLQKGDRFEVKAHHLSDYSRLIVVPCRPDCANPELAYSYWLRFGNQQLQVPVTGQYVFWLERVHSGGSGIPIGGGDRRSPLLIERSDDRGDLFAARFEGGAQVWLRTLYAHAETGAAAQ